MGIPTEDLQSIVKILAAGYLRHRDQLRRELHLLIPQGRVFMDTRLTAMRMEANVETAMRKAIDELSRMPVGQLRQKYIEAFGEESRSNHKQFLFRRIAWRIQALAEGGLSERAAAAHWKSLMTQTCAFGRPRRSLNRTLPLTPSSASAASWPALLTRGCHRPEPTWNASIRADGSS